MLRNRATLDGELSPLARQGWDSVSPVVANVLRLGLYQIRHLDRVPVHAAVNTSVELVREHEPRAAGFVNAILRRITRSAPPSPGPPGDSPADLARRYSHPEWMVTRWLERFGPDGTRRLLEWNNTKPALVVQPARISQESLERKLRDAGINTTPAPFGAGLIVNVSSPRDLPGFPEGDFFVQDPGHALVSRVTGAPEGAVVYDACAAPGGKSLVIGRSGATVMAGDLTRERVFRMRENFTRAGSGSEFPVVADARHPPLASAGAVLLDVPCLGTGTFARHPDARWRVTPEALTQLAERQARLLRATAPLVRAGGLLTYATCSLEPEENLLQVERFLKENQSFRREPPGNIPEDALNSHGDLELLPQEHGTDGAWAARLLRVS